MQNFHIKHVSHCQTISAAPPSGNEMKVTRVMDEQSPGTRVSVQAVVQGITDVTLVRYQDAASSQEFFTNNVTEEAQNYIYHFSDDIVQPGTWELYAIGYAGSAELVDFAKVTLNGKVIHQSCGPLSASV